MEKSRLTFFVVRRQSLVFIKKEEYAVAMEKQKEVFDLD